MKRHLDQLPKTSACHLSPSLPTSVVPYLAFPCPCLAPAGTRIYLAYFYSSSGWKPKVLGGGGNATVNGAFPRRRAVLRPGTDTGRVLIKKSTWKFILSVVIS